jgi:hypothetical protein
VVYFENEPGRRVRAAHGAAGRKGVVANMILLNLIDRISKAGAADLINSTPLLIVSRLPSKTARKISAG